jgi:hypothetical protein
MSDCLLHDSQIWFRKYIIEGCVQDMFCNENAMVCNQHYSSVLFAWFMKICELPVMYHTFFVNYITSSNI